MINYKLRSLSILLNFMHPRTIEEPLFIEDLSFCMVDKHSI